MNKEVKHIKKPLVEPRYNQKKQWKALNQPTARLMRQNSNKNPYGLEDRRDLIFSILVIAHQRIKQNLND